MWCLLHYSHVIYSVCNKVHKEDLCCVLHPLCDWECTMCFVSYFLLLHTCRPSLTRCMHWLTLTYQWVSHVFVSTCLCLSSCTFQLWLQVLHYFIYIVMRCWCNVYCLLLQEKLVIRTVYRKIAHPCPEQGDLVHACTVQLPCCSHVVQKWLL